MAQQNINVSTPNDGLGDTLRTSQVKAQSNFTELYSLKVDKSGTKVLSDTNFTQLEKDKLAGLVEGGQVQTNFTEGNILSKAYILNKPTNVSQFFNDSQFVPDVSIVGGFLRSAGEWVSLTLANIVSALGFTPENVANKSDSYATSSTITYPNTKALVDGLDTKEDKTREKIIYQTNFTTVTDLSVSGAFTIVGNGLKSPATGTFGNTYAVWLKQTVIDKDVTRAIVTINNASSVFGLIRKPSISIEGGTKANINGATNTITIYNGWDGSNTTLASSVSATIPFSLVVGKKYLIELEKLSSGTKTFSITDISNQQTIKIASNNEVNPFSGSCWDSPGVSFESGDVTFNSLSYGSVYNPKPLVMISGDSFVEGNSLVGLGLGAYDKRWAYLIYGALQNDAVISGRGGDSSNALFLRNDTDFFKPKYHLFLIGANDVDFNVWKTNYDAFIAKILTTGAIPVLATIAPRADRQAFINQANAYIKTLPYTVVNFAKAISLNNDEVTVNPAYYMADNVHPNLAGQVLMYNQVKIDFPVLFEKNYELHNAVVKGSLTVTSLIDPLVRTVVVENGVLSSVENGITGSGATNYLSKIVSPGVIGSSLVFDNGENVGLGTPNPITKFNIDKTAQNYASTIPTGGLLITDIAQTQRALDIGTDTNNGIGYIQARNASSATWYDLALNPNGGNVRVGALVGTGSRLVLSDASGNLSAPNIPTAPTAAAGTNTTQIATTAFVQATRPYKVYTALLTQTASEAPVATVLENTLGGTVVWSRTSAGLYVGTLASAFTSNKTAIFNSVTSGIILTSNPTTSTIQLVTRTVGNVDNDSLLIGTTLEIRVYN